MNDSLDRHLDDLKGLLTSYQDVLGLQEWDITLAWVPPSEQAGASRARGNFWESYRQARIELAPERSQAPYLNGELPDNEYDLVHELVHLRFWESCGAKAVEWEIEAMARALVRLRRRSGK